MKSEIRQQLKEKRLSMSEIDRERKSHRIFDKLTQTPEFNSAQNIMVYLSKGEEVVTHFMVKRWLMSNKTLYAPKVDGDHLIACRLDHWEDLDFGPYEVLAPEDVIEIKHPSELDVILVPGVGFTKDGARIGLGKGYYDRFLKQSQALKIGLAYEEQILETLPTEDHDVDMDLVITDQNIYHP